MSCSAAKSSWRFAEGLQNALWRWVGCRNSTQRQPVGRRSGNLNRELGGPTRRYEELCGPLRHDAVRHRVGAVASRFWINMMFTTSAGVPW